MSDTPDTPAPAPVPQPAPVAAAPSPLKPPSALRPPTSVAPAPSVAKLPESPKFVSPMPSIEHADDSIPAFLPIIAGFAAAVAVAFAVLLYLKR